MENKKVVKYQCRSCKEHKDRKEFHYDNFESLIPRKLCWDCDKKQYAQELLKQNKILLGRVRKLESINDIVTPETNEHKIPKFKHKSLNVYMEENNVDKAWFKHKGEYRRYRTFPNQFVEKDSVIVYKRPDGSKKYYGLQKMYEWIMEEKQKEVEAPF